MTDAATIRQKMLETVSRNGGHLASSLGAVEIAMALAEVFEPERDRIVWDVGHQAYAWKLLTGREERFPTLRKLGGISGFPNPHESKADAAHAGHAGVALSVAEGLAAARDARGSGEHVVAVVGDAAIVNGTSFEAMNNCAAATAKVIVVLNDNDMSISKPAGSFARFLGRLTAGVRYNRAKNVTKATLRRFHLSPLYTLGHRLKGRVKSMFFGNVFFEQFGLHYIGPVDGHDLAALKEALTVAKEDRRSVIVHVVTRKGKGFAPAEEHPTEWHGVGPFAYPPADAVPAASAAPRPATWSDAFGAALCEAAGADSRIVALTAGMKDGTGLADFAARFPDRFHDMGIAEGHMMAYAAGLAAGGLRPVVAIYSTFLQRAVDQVMHDVCLANLPVVICVDRAGVVGSDGVTHQGVFDIAMLRCLPNLTICQPKDAADLKALLGEALRRNGPTVIRYPRGTVPAAVEPHAAAGAKVSIWAAGDQLAKANAVAAAVGGEVVHARYLKPYDAAALKRCRAAGMKVVSIENGSVAGGFGEAIGADVRFGWPDEFIPHGTPAELERRYGLDAESLIAKLKGLSDG